MDCEEFSASNAKCESIGAPKENNKGSELSKDQAFLTASELFTVRESLFKNKSKEDLELYKGHKFYYPSECTAAEEIIEDIMADNKKSLNLQRIAKNKDCLKAEWNEKEKVAVIPYLKGKTTQHMGITRNGKCVLSPEETLFLLEKGVIEVENNKMPLSVEEAYSVMLKGKLAVEKYEVYTHLSQQGFIVVSHQARIGPNYLKVMNLSKRKKRKRKAEKSTELPEQKRLTFSGVLTSNSKSVNIENNLSDETLLSNDISLRNDKVISSGIFKENQDIINEKMDLELSNNDADSSNASAIDSQVDREAILNNDAISSKFSTFESHVSLEKEINMSSFEEQIKQNDAVKDLDVPEKDNLDNSNTCMADEVDETDKIIDGKVSETENNEIKITEVNDDVKGIKVNANENLIDIEDVNRVNDEDENLIDIEDVNRVNDENLIDIEDVNRVNDENENIIDIENASNNEIDIENANNADTNEIIIEEDQKTDINVEDSGSVYDDSEEYDSTDESSPVVCEESLDVYSCSPSDHQNNKGLDIETNNAIYKPSAIQDEEVTLVRVMKKEKKPLAVIDLLSDEDDALEESERNGKNTFEDSNEEIEILEEISGTDKNRGSSCRSVSLIKLESSKMKSESSDVKMQPEFGMKYPDTFKKDMICISRPPIHLLPIHCLPAKEVYIFNTEISSQSRPNLQRPKRLWNSYKDMQDYQRERRRERQRNSFAPRSSGPFREQNEPFSNQTSSFCPSEYPRDVDYRNYSYSSPTCRSYYQPLNSERGLLPTPGNFSSSNLPFPMNVHNLQSLSSNPTAFVNEIQKTVYSVASNMISTMLGQHLNPINSHPSYPPPFNNSPPMNFNSHHNNNFSVPPGMPSSMAYNSDRNDYNPVGFSIDPSFSGERNPVSFNESPFMTGNDWRPTNNFRQKKFTPRGPSFPCKYRAFRRKRDWNDIKAAVKGADLSNSGSDIEEVPINLNRFLYSNDIKPLVEPGTKLPVADGLKALKLTQVASLCDTQRNIERYLPTTLTLEISFDVYLPNTNYRRSEPSAPNYRIIIVRASDPIPRYSELVNLQRKWNDGAVLQVAVVDHGDISFYSFNNVNIQELVPFDLLHG